MTAAWREFAGLGILVTLWYAVLTGLQPATCFDGDCGGWSGLALTVALPLASLALTIALACRQAGIGVVQAVDLAGLVRVKWRSVFLAGLYVAAAGAVYPVAALVLAAPLSLSEVWPWRLAGAVAINGLAEEAMMRGYVFRRLRLRNTFWRAAMLSTVLFAAYHLPIVLSQGPIVGAVSVLLAIPLGFVTAYLYDQGRSTLWGPVLLHAGYNGLVFVLVLPAEYQALVNTAYIGVGAVLAATWILVVYRCGFGRSQG